MKKQILLIAILFCTAFAQAQEVFVTADFVSSYIWRGMDRRTVIEVFKRFLFCLGKIVIGVKSQVFVFVL